jgi:ribosomal protein S27AE
MLFRGVATRRPAAFMIVAVVAVGGGIYVSHLGRLLASIDAERAAVQGLEGHAFPSESAAIDWAGVKGEVRAIAFIRPGCPRCEAVTARLQHIQRQSHGRCGVLLVDVTRARTAGAPSRVAGAVRDVDNVFGRVFTGPVTPVLILIARDGRVMRGWVGTPPPDAVERVCDGALAGLAP